jgi:hypothetical protein
VVGTEQYVRLPAEVVALRSKVVRQVHLQGQAFEQEVERSVTEQI